MFAPLYAGVSPYFGRRRPPRGNPVDRQQGKLVGREPRCVVLRGSSVRIGAWWEAGRVHIAQAAATAAEEPARCSVRGESASDASPNVQFKGRFTRVAPRILLLFGLSLPAIFFCGGLPLHALWALGDPFRCSLGFVCPLTPPLKMTWYVNVVERLFGFTFSKLE